MRIGIDARFIGPQGTGLGKYTEKLIQNLEILDARNHYFIFLKKTNWDLVKFQSRNFTKVTADINWYSIEEQIRLPRIFASQNLDLLHVPHFNVPILYKGKLIVTIHDLIHHQFAEQSTTTKNIFKFKTKRIAYKLIILSAIRKSQKIIVPTNYIKAQIIKTFHINPSNIVVTYEAAEEEYFRNQKPETNNQKPFLIYVGNAYPHKNLERLLQAFKILVHSSRFTVHSKKIVNRQPSTVNLKLFIVCPRDVFFQRLEKKIAKRELDKRVKLTGYLTSNELSILMSHAQAYISASQSEGFGIPGLNAMAAKVPVICSDIPTFREVYGNAAFYFNPDDPKDIAQAIKKILEDKKTRRDLVNKGNQQVKKYSWLKMAKQTLKVYESI